MRKRWIQDKNGNLIPEEEYYQREEVNAPMILPDIQPYRSMATGEMITGRRQHREHLKAHGLVEIGNEKMTPKKASIDREGIRRAAAEATYRILG